MEMVFMETSEDKFLCLPIKCLHYTVFTGPYGCRNVFIIRTISFGKGTVKQRNQYESDEFDESRRELIVIQ